MALVEVDLGTFTMVLIAMQFTWRRASMMESSSIECPQFRAAYERTGLTTPV